MLDTTGWLNAQTNADRIELGLNDLAPGQSAEVPAFAGCLGAEIADFAHNCRERTKPLWSLWLGGPNQHAESFAKALGRVLSGHDEGCETLWMFNSGRESPAEAVRRGRCVLVIPHAEEMNADRVDSLLQMMRTGEWVDDAGSVDCRGVVLVFRGKRGDLRLGDGADEEAYRRQLTERFGPEFEAALDGVMVLKEPDLVARCGLVRLELERFRDQCLGVLRRGFDSGILLAWDETVVERLAEQWSKNRDGMTAGKCVEKIRDHVASLEIRGELEQARGLHLNLSAESGDAGFVLEYHLIPQEPEDGRDTATS